jgi:hypothetical protein
VGAGGLGQPERLLARLDELGGRVRRQHVHVDGAQIGDELGEGLGVGVEAVDVTVLELHHEVGERGLLDVVGHAHLHAQRVLDAGHGEHVDVLEDHRPDAAGHDGRHRG